MFSQVAEYGSAECVCEEAENSFQLGELVLLVFSFGPRLHIDGRQLEVGRDQPRASPPSCSRSCSTAHPRH